MSNAWFKRALFRSGFLVLAALFCGLGLSASGLLPPGFRPRPLGVHALVGGRVVVKPGQVLDPGTVVIRDGLIVAVGTDVVPPPEARIWDLKGLTVYAGFIDPHVVSGSNAVPVITTDTEPDGSMALTSPGVKFFGAPGAKTDMGSPGPGSEISRIIPQQRMARSYTPDKKLIESLRELGFTAAVFVPEKGIIRGTSVLVALADEDPDSAVLKADVFQHVAFDTQQSGEAVYPASLMGVIAAIRQSFLDAQHYALDEADYARNPHGRKRPEFDPALEALQPALEKRITVSWEPGSALMVDGAARLAREFGVNFCIVACGQEWRRPGLAGATKAVFIAPLDFPELPKLPEEEDWEQVTLDQLRAWDWAPENPALLRQQGVELALTTYRLKDKERFRQNLELAMDRGLSETDALAALTTVPAKLCGVDAVLGTVEPGKVANLTIVDGQSYFDPEAKVREVWVDGRVYRPPGKVKPEKPAAERTVSQSGESGQPEKPKEAPEKKPQPPAVAEPEKRAKSPAPEKEEKTATGGKGKQAIRELRKARLAHSPLEGRGAIAKPKAVLVEGATVWTCGPAGKLEDADLLVVGGKIKAVGKGLSSRSDYPGPPLVINGHGLQVTPGIIDPHSHSAILGAVNEATLPSTAMVRIQDVVNSETENIYRQLAGGVTAINLLHGSANPIGGQSCLIKLRDGESPEGLIFAAAPPGIKFALGENVKQSNWGDKFVTRFPQTRMGVRTLIENRFVAARQYLADWKKYQASGGVPPRRDLELEALGEVLGGKRWIHAHAYRQDEMLMLMRLMQSFGVQIDSFEHVLEGYKIAYELADAGIAASTFADWWAYKFEVYDAIAYNGSLMRDRGVLVAFNSDSSELARRLYAEAAKAVKYGGTPELEALKFVTLNPAKLLKVDALVGSLEPGKEADFVIWSKSPLDSTTVCLQTWIDGKKYFDRALSPARTLRLEQERSQLIAEAKKIQELGKNDDHSEEKGEPGGGESFFQSSLEHEFDGIADRDAAGGQR